MKKVHLFFIYFYIKYNEKLFDILHVTIYFIKQYIEIQIYIFGDILHIKYNVFSHLLWEMIQKTGLRLIQLTAVDSHAFNKNRLFLLFFLTRNKIQLHTILKRHLYHFSNEFILFQKYTPYFQQIIPLKQTQYFLQTE